MAGPGPNRFYSSTAVQSSLNGAISAGTTSMTVTSTTGFPVSLPYTLSIDQNAASEELVTVTGVSALVLTIVRGQDGTAGVFHNNGAPIVHAISARDLAEPQVHLGGNDNVHGLTAGQNVVGDTATQTLTNKTLSSPVLSGTATGTYTLGGTGTLSSPTINTPTLNGSGGLLTLPAGPDTLVARSTTDTLVNKTLTTPVINSGTLNGTTAAGTINSSGSVTAAQGMSVSAGQQFTTANNIARPVAGPVWQAYTPTVGGTGASLGNGSLSGNYVQYGRITFFEIVLTVGSTTAWGSTGITLSAPAAPTNLIIAEGQYVTGPNLNQLAGMTTGASATLFVVATSSAAPGGLVNLVDGLAGFPGKTVGDKLYLFGTMHANS